MEKLRMESLNLTSENIAKVEVLFPNIITEAKDENGKLKKAINFDLLRQILSSEVLEGDEAYEFTWVGKKASIVEAGKPIRKTLRPCKQESKNWDTTENLYIEGDNLEVLKLLQESYLGKVKMIYIDPPYNTGNDFVYRDNFTRDKDEYVEEAGVYDEGGDRLFRNTETNGRFHSDWCSMMYPRLVLARNLLRDDGVVFISIDDNEIDNLKKICDEVFGSQNFEAMVAWRRRHNQPNDKTKMIAKVAESIIVYAKCSIQLAEKKSYHGLPLSQERLAEYKNPDNDPNGKWTSNPWKAATGRGGTDYTIVTPTGKVYKETWYGNPTTFETLLSKGRIHWTDSGNGVPRVKVYIRDAQREGQAAINFFTHEKFGSNQDGSAEIESLFGVKGIFDNPKPSKLLTSLIMLATEPDSVILDFFSGSATTAHAVMKLNADDGGKRKFIMVQLPEACPPESEAFKSGYKNICEIGKERIRRAGDRIKDEAGLLAQNLDIGFRVFKVDDTNMKEVFYSADAYSQGNLDELISNIKEDRTDLDLLFACLLEWGLPLSMPHTSETISGCTVHTYNNGDLIACFEKDIPDSVVKEIAKRQPLRVVFRDSSFTGAPEKINVTEIFKLMAPNTGVRVI